MTQRPVYQTDSDGFFLYQSVANELPRSPGTFNIPFGAYEDAPPESDRGLSARRERDRWELVEDHRSTKLWTVEAQEPYTIGSTLRIAGEDLRYPGWGPIPGWLSRADPSSQPAD